MPLPRRRSCVEGIISGMPLLILRRDLVPGRTLAAAGGSAPDGGRHPGVDKQRGTGGARAPVTLQAMAWRVTSLGASGRLQGLAGKKFPAALRYR